MATAGVTAAKINCNRMLNPQRLSEKLRGNKDEVSFGLWKKPLYPPLITETRSSLRAAQQDIINNSSSHPGSFRATQQQIVDCLNNFSSRQETVPVIQVLLEDKNGVILNELRDICKDFNSSNKSRSTSKLLLDIMRFLLRHDKSSIHRKVEFMYDFNPKSKNLWLYSCSMAEYGVKVKRTIGKLFRLLKWGRNSSTVLIRVMTHIDNDDVCMEEFGNCLAELEDGDVDVDDLFRKVCKGDKIAMHLSSTVCFQPKVYVYALAEQDFGESPTRFVFEAVS